MFYEDRHFTIMVLKMDCELGLIFLTLAALSGFYKADI